MDIFASTILRERPCTHSQNPIRIRTSAISLMTHIAKYAAAFICASLLGVFTVLGDHISEPQARSIAARGMAALAKTHTRGATSPSLRLSYQQVADNGQADLYVYTPSEGEGFIIVAGDDCLPQIVGYSTDNRFKPDSIPAPLKNMFTRYGQLIKAMSGCLRGAQRPALRSWNAVEPLLGNLAWGQGNPYNALTPKVDGNRAPTGCVATALAQVMRYHCWPANGIGKGVYTINGKNKKTVSIDGHSYNWTTMHNSYGSTTSTEENYAVARLLYDVGVAARMSYSKWESSAFSAYAATALIENFSYSRALRAMNRMYHTSDEWEAAIQEELQAKRPVYYAGGSPGGGHAFVCDGYDGKSLYHINWGWNGLSNGYYALIELLPGSQGIGAGGGGGYITEQDMIVGVQPDYVKTDPKPLIYAEKFKIDDTKPAPGSSAIQAIVSAFNYSGKAISGNLGVEVVNAANVETAAQFKANSGDKDIKLGWGPNDTTVNISTDDLTPGTYRVFPSFYMSDTKTWERIRVPLNEPQFWTLSVGNGGEVTVLKDNAYKVSLIVTGITTPRYEGQNTVSITYTNFGSVPYNGLIGFRLVSDKSNTSFSSDGKGVYYTNSFIEPGGSVTYKDLAIDTKDATNGLKANYVQVLYDSTNQKYNPDDNLRLIPHHVLTTIPISTVKKELKSPLCKILSSTPRTCKQGDLLSVQVSVKLDDAGAYFSGPIELQFLQSDSKGTWIRGNLGRTAYVTLNGISEETLTFEGNVGVASGEYILSVGVLKYDPKENNTLWYSANPQSEGVFEEVERSITVELSSDTALSTLPIVLHLDEMKSTAVETPAQLPLRAYPNPARSVVYVQTVNGLPIRSAALYTLHGQCVKRIDLGATSTPDSAVIDVSQLPKGLYILHAFGEANGQNGSVKIVVE